MFLLGKATVEINATTQAYHPNLYMPYLLYLDSGIDTYIPNPNVVQLTKEVYTIGRASDRDIAIKCRWVSNLQCTLLKQDKDYFLVDGDGVSTSSTNGTFINSRTRRAFSSPAILLSDGDVIMFGSLDFLKYFEGDLPSDDDGTGVPARLPKYPGSLSTEA